MLGVFTAPAIAVLHFIGIPIAFSSKSASAQSLILLKLTEVTGEAAACAHSCPCVPSAAPSSSSYSQHAVKTSAFTISRCGRRSDGAAVICASALTNALSVLGSPPCSLPVALSKYLSSLQQPQHSLRLRALFRSAFLFQASKSKCLAVSDAVVLLQYVA
jgi:hypothetical protein